MFISNTWKWDASSNGSYALVSCDVVNDVFQWSPCCTPDTCKHIVQYGAAGASIMICVKNIPWNLGIQDTCKKQKKWGARRAGNCVPVSYEPVAGVFPQIPGRIHGTCKCILQYGAAGVYVTLKVSSTVFHIQGTFNRKCQELASVKILHLFLWVRFTWFLHSIPCPGNRENCYR